MNVHKNAKLTPFGRAEIGRRVLEEMQTPEVVAPDVALSTVARMLGHSNPKITLRCALRKEGHLA